MMTFAMPELPSCLLPAAWPRLFSGPGACGDGDAQEPGRVGLRGAALGAGADEQRHGAHGPHPLPLPRRLPHGTYAVPTNSWWRKLRTIREADSLVLVD